MKEATQQELERFREGQRSLRHAHFVANGGEEVLDLILANTSHQLSIDQVRDIITEYRPDELLRLNPDAFANPDKPVGTGPDGEFTQAELDQHYGYVYRVEHLPTGRYYIGQHRHTIFENFNHYVGSGTRWTAEVLDRHPFNELRKEVLCFCDDALDLNSTERWLIFEEGKKLDERFMNIQQVFYLPWLRKGGQLVDPYEAWEMDPPHKVGEERWLASYLLHDPFGLQPMKLQVIAPTYWIAIGRRWDALQEYAEVFEVWEDFMEIIDPLPQPPLENFPAWHGRRFTK